MLNAARASVELLLSEIRAALMGLHAGTSPRHGVGIGQ